MELTRLFTMGSRWYATLKDGNLTIGGMFGAPTEFPATMSREAVLAAIRAKTPSVTINLPVEA
jgi:hypothetical protein